jgi:two-component system, sensor histidine kinase and response regulator
MANDCFNDLFLPDLNSSGTTNAATGLRAIGIAVMMQVLEGGLSRKPVRVLIADDDAALRSLVNAKLSGRVASVTEAADGQEAWDLLLGRTFELAIIDLSMPGIDGFTLTRCMRSHPRTRHMPIIVITSSTDQAAVTRAFEAGATSFLTKPINWPLFAHHIDYLVRLSQGSSAERVTKQRAEAVARAKDAVIAKLATRVRRQTGRLIESCEAELCRLGGTGAGSADFAAAILSDALAIEETLGGVLPYARSVTEQIVVDDRPVRLGRLVERCVRELEPVAEARGVLIEIVHLSEELLVRCDEAALVRAFANLLRNAVTFTRPKTSVRIEAQLRSDNVLALSVEDQGPGVDAEVIAKCLAPLDRHEWLRPEIAERATIGLPIAKAIAQAHGGTVEVISLAQGGALASLILPAEIVEMPQEDAA